MPDPASRVLTCGRGTECARVVLKGWGSKTSAQPGSGTQALLLPVLMRAAGPGWTGAPQPLFGPALLVLSG